MKRIEISIETSDFWKSELFKKSYITFNTEVADGTASKDVLAYANDAARLLNNNAHKLDESIVLSDETSHGGLYKDAWMYVNIYPEGMKGQTNRYYVSDILSGKTGEIIELEKNYS